MFNLGVNRWKMVLKTSHTQNGKGNENLSLNVHLCSPSFPAVEFKLFTSVTHFRSRNLGCKGAVPFHGQPRIPFWNDKTSLGLLSAHYIVIALWKYKYLPVRMKHQQNAQAAHFLVQTRLWTSITLPHKPVSVQRAWICGRYGTAYRWDGNYPGGTNGCWKSLSPWVGCGVPRTCWLNWENQPCPPA